MKNFSYSRKTCDKLTIKGVLSSDADSITFINDNKDEQDVTVADCLNPFADKSIVLTISVSDEEDLMGE